MSKIFYQNNTLHNDIIDEGSTNVDWFVDKSKRDDLQILGTENNYVKSHLDGKNKYSKRLFNCMTTIILAKYSNTRNSIQFHSSTKRLSKHSDIFQSYQKDIIETIESIRRKKPEYLCMYLGGGKYPTLHQTEHRKENGNTESISLRDEYLRFLSSNLSIGKELKQDVVLLGPPNDIEGYCNVAVSTQKRIISVVYKDAEDENIKGTSNFAEFTFDHNQDTKSLIDNYIGQLDTKRGSM